MSSTTRLAEHPRGDRGGWRLGLEPLEFKNSEAEAAYERSAARQSLQTDPLHFAGGAALHVLVSFALYRAGAFPMACIVLASAGYMAATALLIVRRPATYLRCRQGLYAFQCLWGMLEAKWLLEYLHLSVGSTTGGLLFWLPDIVVNSAMPWQILHTLVYRMPLRTAVVVQGVAAGVLLSSNPYRCSVTLGSCPVSGRRVAEMANQASSALSIFSSASRATLFDPNNPRHQQRACLLTYAVTQVVVGYVAALRMAWCQDRWARLHYLRRLESADAVEMEWMLERLQPSLVVMVLELAFSAAVLWACIQVYYLNF